MVVRAPAEPEAAPAEPEAAPATSEPAELVAAAAPEREPIAAPAPATIDPVSQPATSVAPVATATAAMGFQNGAANLERNGCTAPQLRRFIKSRAYVPMHELRRRFVIDGDDDDVTAVDLDRGARIFVGLPQREGWLLGELFRAGDIGYELSLDPVSPIVVGVFPMRPVPRA